MENAKKQYMIWMNHDLPEDLRQELIEIENDETEIYNRFCKNITFGTSGLRGKMGAGSNCINSVVLRRASRGVSAYLLSKYKRPKLVIGYDTRINSKEYAAIVAEEFSRCGIDVCLFSKPTPVPVVSFAIRFLKINGGIMITASHNTKEYNGYKVYDHFGNQIDDDKARLIEKYIEEKGDFNRNLSKQQGNIEMLSEQVKEAYLQAIFSRTPWWDTPENCIKALENLNVVYTPLNGAGLKYVARVAEHLKLGKFTLVDTQKEPDGNFTTCPSPNPENTNVFDEAIRLYGNQGADLIVATDPDSDRMGVMVFHKGEYKRLTGNQVGELMLEYICLNRQRKPEGRPVAFKSLVSSPLAEDICRAYNVEMKNVLIGFKNIAYEMERLNDEGRQGDFLFGFEESLGYLLGDYTRDKDGVMAFQIICLIAAFCKNKGKTLVDMLEDIYCKYGYLSSAAYSKHYENEADRQQITDIMHKFFDGELSNIGGEAVLHDCTFKEHMLYRGSLEGKHTFIVRPSGTELKLKTYVFAKGGSYSEAEEKASEIMNEIIDFIDKNDKSSK